MNTNIQLKLQKKKDIFTWQSETRRKKNIHTNISPYKQLQYGQSWDQKPETKHAPLRRQRKVSKEGGSKEGEAQNIQKDAVLKYSTRRAGERTHLKERVQYNQGIGCMERPSQENSNKSVWFKNMVGSISVSKRWFL